MNRRGSTLAAIGTLVLASLFYALSPTVYAYFSEIWMEYSLVPAALARTPAAVATARYFDAYNANAPRAQAFQRELSCYLAGEHGAAPSGCVVEVQPGARVQGPPDLKISSGRYIGVFAFASNDHCGGGDARIEIDVDGRFGRVLNSLESTIRPGEKLEIPFHVRLMDAALGTVSFRISGESGCVLLTRATWRRA
jgi:hypothetical protein